MILFRRLAGVAASAALALAGTAVLAPPAVADSGQYAHIEIKRSIRSGYYSVRVYGRINIPAHQNPTVTMRLKGDDPAGDDDLGVTATGPVTPTIGDPPGPGSFSMSVEVTGSALDEDWGDDEIYAWVGASTGWDGLTENVYGNY
jgi:hypothetical protein